MFHGPTWKSHGTKNRRLSQCFGLTACRCACCFLSFFLSFGGGGGTCLGWFERHIKPRNPGLWSQSRHVTQGCVLWSDFHSMFQQLEPCPKGPFSGTRVLDCLTLLDGNPRNLFSSERLGVPVPVLEFKLARRWVKVQ